MRSATAAAAASGSRFRVTRVDVAEDGRRVLVEEAVRRGDEAERGGHHLVAPPPAERPHAEVQRGRPGGDRDGVVDPSQSAKSRSNRSSTGPSDSWPERSTSSTSSSSRGPEVGSGERDRLGPSHGAARYARPSSFGAGGRSFGWNAYSSESTSASQRGLDDVLGDADRPPGLAAVGGVEQDPGDRAGAVVGRRGSAPCS